MSCRRSSSNKLIGDMKIGVELAAISRPIFPHKGKTDGKEDLEFRRRLRVWIVAEQRHPESLDAQAVHVSLES